MADHLRREAQQLGLSEASAERMIEALSRPPARMFVCPDCCGGGTAPEGLSCHACGGWGCLTEREWDALRSLRYPEPRGENRRGRGRESVLLVLAGLAFVAAVLIGLGGWGR